MNVRYTVGWRRFLTLTYWRFQLARWVSGQPELHIIAIVDIETPDSCE
jgi:hypothetical protein